MWATTEPVKQVNLHHSWTSGGFLSWEVKTKMSLQMNQPLLVLPIQSSDMKQSLVYLVQWGRTFTEECCFSLSQPADKSHSCRVILAQQGTICRLKRGSCSSCPLPCDCWQAFETHPIDEFYLTAAPPSSPANSLPAIGSWSQLAIPAPRLLWTGAK